MGRIEVKTGTNEGDEKAPLPFVTLLLLMAGVFGILLFIKSLDGVEYQSGIVFPAAAVLCCVVWYSYTRHKKLFWAVLLIVMAGCSLFTFLLWDVLAVQTAHIASSLQGEPGLHLMQITETAFLLAAILTMLLFVLECMMKSHVALYVFTTMLLLIAPLLGIHANVETVFLLILFQLAFWVIQITGSKRNKQLVAGSRNRMAGKSGIIISIAVVLAFFTALPLVISRAEKLYNYVYTAEGFVYRSLNTMSGRANEPVTGGRISRGNNYHTGAAHLMITASGQPTETLYLRGFGGGEYTGGDWIRSSDEALFDNITENHEGSEWIRMISDMYYNMYYILNMNMHNTYYVMSEGTVTGEQPGTIIITEKRPETIMLVIQHMNGGYDNLYVPYYSQRQYGMNYDGYVYRYYEQKDMDIDWGKNVSSSFQQQKDWYRELQQAYLEQAGEAYTQVPTELLPRLTALVRENPLTELDEITAFILYTLHSNATYTLTPGWTAFNEDVVEYFLFERGTGFCEHFAVTATLMYRLYGIPARYATGYMVSPSDFELQEDGNYLAVVTDEAAHAWVEIFLEDYGWTPVEVTPASDGSAVASYPGFDNAQMNWIWRNRGWDVTVPGLTEDTTGALPSVGQSEGTDFLLEIDIDWEKFRDWFLVLNSCLVYSILLLPLFLDYRRLRLLRRIDSMGCRATYDELLEMIHFGGLMPEYDGSEGDFADRLAESIGSISKDEARRLVEVVNKAAFGPSQPDNSEEAFVRRVYRHTAEQIYTGLSWKKKFIFKLVKVFG